MAMHKGRKMEDDLMTNRLTGADSVMASNTMRTENQHIDKQFVENPRTEGATDAHRPDQISKDGDTLELSKKTIPDAMLKGVSDSRLKTMLHNKEISRQQYDKVMSERKNADGFMVKI